MASVLWLPEAIADVERLVEFLREVDVDAATACIASIRKGASLLESTPRLGKPLDDTGRRELYIAFGAGAYVLRYMLNRQGDVVIIRVWHSRELRD